MRRAVFVKVGDADGFFGKHHRDRDVFIRHIERIASGIRFEHIAVDVNALCVISRRRHHNQGNVFAVMRSAFYTHGRAVRRRGDRDGVERLFKARADRDVLGGHGEHIVSQRARAGGVAREGISRGTGVAERERHRVILARIGLIVVLQAAVVFIRRDAADIICRRVAAEGERHVIVCGDSVSLFALCITESTCVVAVIACRAVADKGRAVG